MARTLAFNFDGQPFRCAVDKVERSDLYGRIDIEIHDRSGQRCDVATLAADGRTLITSGGTGLGYMSGDGRWIERSELVAVDVAGRRLNTVPSSFDAAIDLDIRTSADRFLDHSIRSSYLLSPEEPGLPAAFEAELSSGTIFKFDFSWRSGINTDPAFVMKGADGAVWMLVGAECNADMVGFAQAASLDATDDEAGAGDDLDFEMM